MLKDCNKLYNMDPIIINDPTIVSFYNENTNIDIVSINHIFIDILKKLSTNLNETLTNNINHKILSMLTELGKDISSLKQDVASQLQSTKHEYIENMKLTLSNYLLTNNEKTQNIIDKNTDIMITKTANILNEIIPKHHFTLHSTINETIKQLHSSILTDTNKLINSINKDDNTITEFISNIDSKFNTLITNIQQPIFSCIQQNDDRTASTIQSMRDKLVSQQTSQDKLHGDLYEFLNKYKHNSSSKGNVSEHELYCILQEIFHNDEIIDCSAETATCDYKVNRLNPNNPTILFENKDYAKTVSTDEIKKFERDIALQKHHGIFISQNSNITFKNPYQIDIINNLIHIYLPNTKYNVEKIRVAVNIIDHLSVTLNQIKLTQETTNTTIQIDESDINDLLALFNDFNTQKAQIIATIQSSNKTILDQLENLQINAVKKLLNKNNLSNDDIIQCPYCNKHDNSKGKASFSAHMRQCVLNPNKVSKASGKNSK
jgi:hypothetical protein